MGVLGEAFENIRSYLSLASVMDVVDVAIVAFAIYKLMVLVRKSTAAQVLKGIALLVVVLALSGLFGLNVINYILTTMMQVGFIAVIIMFQPELRKILEKFGANRFNRFFMHREGDAAESGVVISQVVSACGTFSQEKTGALIVFERRVLLDDLVRTGTIINADVSTMLVKNIFFKNAALHDGAMIIRENRVLAAGCVLPNSSNTSLSRDLGTRHRAGVGVSEASDAVVVIVSEETGTISVATDGMLKRHLTTETLMALLRKELLPAEEGEDATSAVRKRVNKVVSSMRSTFVRPPKEKKESGVDKNGWKSRKKRRADKNGGEDVE